MGIKYLRKYIRKQLLESRELQNQMSDLFQSIPEETTLPGNPHPEIKLGHREYAKQALDKYPEYTDQFPREELEKTIDKNFDVKRQIKRFWNENADHQWFKDHVIPIHDLTYYGEDSDSFEMDKDLKLETFFRQYPPGKIQKDEMSCWGTTKAEGAESIIGKSRRTPIGLSAILKGRITWASKRDSYTESRSLASTEDLKRHASSGLPKRPSIQSFSSRIGENAIFDQEDYKRSGRFGELVVDNWTYDTIVIWKPYFSRWGEDDEPWLLEYQDLCDRYKVTLEIIE
tara:strand:- start:227 stop:1084 length:858 start_codon:yes stop_codon:yes gene_type:complete